MTQNIAEDGSAWFGFTTNDSTGARVDMSATPTQADFQVFKDGALMTLDALSVICTKVASTTGTYEVEIDTSVDADFTTNSTYMVLLYPDETVDSQSVSSWLGNFTIESSTAVTVGTVNDKTGYRLSATGVDDIWDEGTSGHVTAGSFGALMYTIRSATAQAGAATSITLDASANANNDFYNNQRIHIVSGTGVGQGNFITDYDGTTKVADVQDTWAVTPDATSVFVISPFGGIPGASAPTAAAVADAVWNEAMADHQTEGSFGTMLQSFHDGTAQAGTVSSITLDATGSSATDSYYRYAEVEIITGTGAGQSRQITAYVGSSKVATVAPNWTTAPSTDSQYIIRGIGIDAATVDAVADAVWDEARSGHISAGSFGEYVLADTTRVSGSTSAADGLEAAVSGATPLPSNVTQWLGSAVAAVTQAGVPEVDVTFVGGVAQDIATATALSTVSTNTTNIEADTQNIQSRLPAALNNGAIPADIQRINDVAVVGDGSGTPFTV